MDNHLYARELFGNDAVNFTDASNTVISNHPGSTFLTVNATDISYGDSLYITVSVTENATGTITITNTEANSTEYKSDIFDGMAVFNITGFDVGNYTFNVTYSGDDNYDPCQSNFTVAVNKKLVDMTITAGDITYGEAATITQMQLEQLQYASAIKTTLQKSLTERPHSTLQDWVPGIMRP